MQMYILDLETLLSLLEEVGQNGRLFTELPTGVPGLKERCQARVDLQEGKIVFCQIEARNSRILATGMQALQLLSDLGPREWQLVETQSTESLSFPAQADPPSRYGRSSHTASLIPQRTPFIDRSVLDRLPRHSRQVLNLVDGTRSIERIAILLHPSADRQTIQQVERIVLSLEAMRMITLKNLE